MLTMGIFPESLKIAKIKPLYKKADASNFNNYRPISLLPVISKIFVKNNSLSNIEVLYIKCQKNPLQYRTCSFTYYVCTRHIILHSVMILK